MSKRYLTLIFLSFILLLISIWRANIQNDQLEVAASSTPAPLPQPVGQSGHWDLLFSDDFEGSSLDSSKWTTCYWWDQAGCTNIGNNELQWYQPDELLLSDGSLKLRAQERRLNAADGKSYQYTSGMITTGRSKWERNAPSKFVFQLGYAEIRAKVPAGKGLWSAFWMLPDNHESLPEIDVMETLGHEPSTVQMHLHYLNSEGDYENVGNQWTGADLSADWHTFAVDWQAETIIWYVDGIERWRVSDPTHIPQEPMYLLANLAVGGDWPGEPEASTAFPSYYEIDYIRVWKKGGEAYLSPIADTFIDDDYPSINFGANETLYVDAQPEKVAYLKFDLSSLSGEIITSATLRLKTTSELSAGSYDSQQIKLLNLNIWDENEVTYDNSVVSSNLVGEISDTLPNTTYDIPLEHLLLQPYIGNVLTLYIDSTSEDGVYFYSKENSVDSPQLIITTSNKR